MEIREEDEEAKEDDAFKKKGVGKLNKTFCTMAAFTRTFPFSAAATKGCVYLFSGKRKGKANMEGHTTGIQKKKMKKM